MLTVLTLSLAALQAPAQATPTLLETARSAGQFETLLAAAEAAGLTATLAGKGPFTVLAPTDAAFEKLPKGTLDSLLQKKNRELLRTVLLYHVVPGTAVSKDVAAASKRGWVETASGQRLPVKSTKERLTIGGAGLVQTDLRCANGVIHVVDTVLIPRLEDILEVAASAGTFTTLTAAIETAGLVEALKAEGPFTVFAPTDEAFAALPAGTVASLLEPENRAQLVAILKLHVVSGRWYSDRVAAETTLTSLGGGSLSVRAGEDGVFIGGARVIAADQPARNGVIHVIDRVLLPQE